MAPDPERDGYPRSDPDPEKGCYLRGDLYGKNGYPPQQMYPQCLPDNYPGYMYPMTGYAYGYPGYPQPGGQPGYWPGWPPGYDPYGTGKGGMPSQHPPDMGYGSCKGGNSNDRSRSPRPSRSTQDATPGPPLERLQGAVRDTRPGWMTKGLGIGVEYFGETKGDLVKPGMTNAELEALEKRGLDEGPDPFGEVFKEQSNHRNSQPSTARAPLPDQHSMFAGCYGGLPFPSQPSSHAREIRHSNPNKFKLELCRFWEQNKCSRGASCTFAHGNEDLKKA